MEIWEREAGVGGPTGVLRPHSAQACVGHTVGSWFMPWGLSRSAGILRVWEGSLREVGLIVRHGEWIEMERRGHVEVGGGTLRAGYQRHVACLRKREKENYACPDPNSLL